MDAASTVGGGMFDGFNSGMSSSSGAGSGGGFDWSALIGGIATLGSAAFNFGSNYVAAQNGAPVFIPAGNTGGAAAGNNQQQQQQQPQGISATTIIVLVVLFILIAAVLFFVFKSSNAAPAAN